MDDPRPFGLVHGRIYVGVGDTNDAGRAPDRVVVSSGTATFTGTTDRVITNTPGSEAIDITQTISAQINNGALQWNGVDDVPLIANLDLSGNRLGWQWRVDFSGLKYTDPFTVTSKPVSLTGWTLDVKPYVEGFVDPVTGTNTTITQITSQAPVVTVAPTIIAKGDPGGIVDLTVGTVTTTTDPSAASVTIAPTVDPLKKSISFVLPVGSGSGGGTGTVTKVAGVSPDGTGNVNLPPSAIGAATTGDVVTAQQTASNALSAATSAQTAANSAQVAANNALAGLPLKADITALVPFAPKDSPTFTGDPKAPTPATTDNDTSVATTAFVRAAISNYAPAAGGGTANQVYWNATTQAWTATTRPSVTGPVVLWSTNDAGATRPSWMAIGDAWVQHPDAVGG